MDNQTTSTPAFSADPWQEFLTHGLLGPSRLIENAAVEISAVETTSERVPLITNRRGDPDCSWVTSLRNAYGRYARAETDIVEMNRFLQPLYLAGSYAAEAILGAG